jgi:hypothetical protein
MKVEVIINIEQEGILSTGVSKTEVEDLGLYVDTIVEHCKRAVIACGYMPSTVNEAFKESEDI